MLETKTKLVRADELCSIDAPVISASIHAGETYNILRTDVSETIGDATDCGTYIHIVSQRTGWDYVNNMS